MEVGEMNTNLESRLLLQVCALKLLIEKAYEERCKDGSSNPGEYHWESSRVKRAMDDVDREMSNEGSSQGGVR